jgi:hypothetical protein
MNPQLFAVTSLLAAGLAISLGAQEQRDPREVQPERPTVATHAHTVAPGFMEIEAGTQALLESSSASHFAWPVVVKVGLSTHTQLNLTLPTPNTDGGVGLKWRLLDDSPLLGDFAVLPFMTFSSGHNQSLGTTVIASYMAGETAIDLNLTYQREELGTKFSRDAALWTASFGFPVARRWGWVLEFFGDIPTAEPIGSGRSPATLYVLTGPTFTVEKYLALDVGVIKGINSDHSTSAYAGFVWNVGRLFGGNESAIHGLRRR